MVAKVASGAIEMSSRRTQALTCCWPLPACAARIPARLTMTMLTVAVLAVTMATLTLATLGTAHLRRADRVAVLEVAEQSAGAIDDRHGAHLRGSGAAVRGSGAAVSGSGAAIQRSQVAVRRP